MSRSYISSPPFTFMDVLWDCFFALINKERKKFIISNKYYNNAMSLYKSGYYDLDRLIQNFSWETP
jgi:hypothetical protein